MSNEIMQETTTLVECSAFHRAMSVLEASLRNTEDSEAIINGLLKGVAEFYGASRASVLEADWELGIGVITYEWCKDGVQAQRDISQEMFDQAQQLRKTRKREPTPLHDTISRQIRCSCGARVRAKKINQKWCWCCCNHEERHECQITPIPEIQVQKSFCRLYYKLKHQSIPILEQMLTNLQMVRNRRMLWSPDIVALNKRISDISSQNQTLAFLKQQGLVDPDIFIAKTNELTKQLRQVKLEKEKLVDAESDMTALQTRDLIDILEDGPEFLDSFDTELFGELVEKIIIESNDSVRFCLKNGLELRESIERTMR